MLKINAIAQLFVLQRTNWPEYKAFHPIRCCVTSTDANQGASFYKEIRKGVITIVQVIVRDNNVDQALRALKKKMQREGLFREMKLRRHYEKPSVKKARERSEAVRRHRKLERKRKERDGE